MAARLKLTSSCEQRLLELLELGEPLTSASRAVGVSREAVRRKGLRDRGFGERVSAARDAGRGQNARVAGELGVCDWRVAARQLARQWPQRWGPVGERHPVTDP